MAIFRAQHFGDSDHVLADGDIAQYIVVDTLHPLFSPGSDSIPIDMDEPYGWYEHQRRGALTAYLKQAVQQEAYLETAIMKASALPAQQFRSLNWGLISTGNIAELMMVDLDRYSFPSPAESDPNDPFPMASGVEAVIVSGVPILLKGEVIGAKLGGVSCS